jgi:hypothetical protein
MRLLESGALIGMLHSTGAAQGPCPLSELLMAPLTADGPVSAKPTPEHWLWATQQVGRREG